MRYLPEDPVSLLVSKSGPRIGEVVRRVRPFGGWIAGGAIRDLCLDRSSLGSDVDIFIPAAKEAETIRSLSELGRIARGPFGAWMLTTPGLETHVDLVVIEKFNNGVGPCRTIEDCLGQFDVTVNAAAYAIHSQTYVTHRFFEEDLNASLLRAVRLDFPDEHFSSDTSLTRNAVLWFRIRRLARELGFTIEDVTNRWVIDHFFYSSLQREYERVFSFKTRASHGG